MRAIFCCLALLWLLPQCGGAASTASDAKSGQSDADHPQRSSASSNADEDAEPSSTSAPAAEKSKGPSCDDGTCSLCGGGICPAGWYCDEKASGGGACSWLTECAEKPTCACVTRVLGASCKCREENGGLKVACD